MRCWLRLMAFVDFLGTRSSRDRQLNNMLEREVEGAFVREGKKRGCWVPKLVMFRAAGFPDRTVLGQGGRIAFVELKRPGGKTSRLQDIVLKRLRKLGFTAVVIDHPDQIVPFYNRLFGPIG